MAFPELDRPDWIFEEPPPSVLPSEAGEALVAEAQFSKLGLFRLETRESGGGYVMIVRHDNGLDDGRLASVAEAVAAEAERFGVRARVRFNHDPTLQPTS